VPGLEDDFVGSSPAIVAFRQQVERLLSRFRAGGRLPPILILGETGAGKSQLVRAMHRLGPRRDGPLVEINRAAVPESLLESELFGYQRGAFTGAREAKPGLFHAADRGVLFLDEIDMAPLAAQAKLLTAIERREVRRLGSRRAEPLDVWIMTTAKTDLHEGVRAGRFRLDLYHRISALVVAVPALRDRGGDVVELAERGLSRACTEYDLPPRYLCAGAEAALLFYWWPGNVRELLNVMERSALLAEDEIVSPALMDLPAPRWGPPPERADFPHVPYRSRDARTRRSPRPD
jgi:DNA-binding NtrC family response regulator